MSTTLLKLNGSSGDLKEMTTTEEQYIAQQVATYLTTNFNINSPGMISKLSSTLSVGSFSDTKYNQATGTHPASSISSSTTTTNLYQSTSTSIPDDIYPVCWSTTSGTGIHEMTSAEMDTICTRILYYIIENELPGSLRMATTAPANYTNMNIDAQGNNILFYDTRNDGTINTYYLYKKTAGNISRTAVRPMRLSVRGQKNLREMSDAEIQSAFGKRCMNLMKDVVGRYSLSITAPAGTWLNRGTATDTIHTLTEVDYTRTRSTNYTRRRITNYSRTRATYYTRTRATYYTRNSGWGYIGNFLGNFVGNFLGNFAGNYTGDYVGDFVGDFLGNYVGTTIAAATTNSEIKTLWVRLN